MKAWNAVLAFAACGLLAGAATAGKADEIAKALAAAIRAQGLGRILDEMPQQAWDELADDPAALAELAGACAGAAPKLAGSDPANWKRLVEQLDRTCGSIQEGEKESAAARAALGATGFCRLRVDLATGGTFDAKRWQETAGHYLAAHEKEPGEGEYLEQAARILALGARAGDEETLRKMSLELCIRGARSYPRNEYFAAARHAAELSAIETTLEKHRREAKVKFLQYLEDIEAGKFGTGAMRDTAHTRAVTFARNHKKLGVKPDYKTETVVLGTLSLEIPKGRQWKKSGSKVYQYDEDGNLIRSIRYRTYSWDTNYYLGAQTFGGDNIKGLARIGETDVLSVVVKVKHRRKVNRTRLNRKIRSTVGFVIGGLDSDGEYLCYRWYYFQSERKKLTSVKIGIVEFVDEQKPGPEAEFVIESIREDR